MGAIHSTERNADAQARLFAHVKGLGLHGAPAIMLDGDARFRTDKEPRMLRLSLEPMPWTTDGYVAADVHARGARSLLVCDLWWRNAAAEGEAYDAYGPDRCADDLAHALRGLALSWQDYADPAVPVAVAGHPIRVLWQPRVERLPPMDGFERRQVTAEIRWFARVAA